LLKLSFKILFTAHLLACLWFFRQEFLRVEKNLIDEENETEVTKARSNNYKAEKCGLWGYTMTVKMI
jgi:hypothetical protein